MPTRRIVPQLFCLALTLILCAQVGAAENLAGADFARDVLPILSDKCFHCHGPDEKTREAKLRLDTKEGAFRRIGDVAVIVPGKSAESELYKRITTPSADDLMPPPDSNRKLTPKQIDLIKRWIDSGAEWSKHWAFVPPRKSALPKTKNTTWPKNAIDHFILARLEAEGLSPNDEATKTQLIRRVTLDLTGLPPTPEEVDAFVNDTSSEAYEKVVDRLLASPRYGERWVWDWLDAARYADTNGYQGDPTRTMWPWRDWAIRAINGNMPYDQFTVEQLAGDLLPKPTRDQKLATGFHRNHMHNGEGGRIAEETRVENVMDRVETTATLWLGLTFTCCRCHDHKYDPLTLRDYYGMYDFFNQTSETGQGRGGQAPPVLDMATREEIDRAKQAADRVNKIAEDVVAFELKKFPRPEGVPLSDSDAAKLPGNLPNYIAQTEPKNRSVDALLEAVGYFETTGNDPAYVKVLKKLLAAVREKNSAASRITRVMVMDQIAKPRDTFILTKGAYDKPTDVKVIADVPASLGKIPADQPRNRLALARWIVDPANPLTARVTVNRYWQSLFGTGLVKTVEDFGLQGERPSHPELLDYLAAQFVESGWNVKALHKLIVMSSTYRQSARSTPELNEKDPDNRLLARGPRHRLPSWMIRDQALAVSGLLTPTLFGPPVKPYQPEGIWEEATFGKITYTPDTGDALYRRSLYIFWRRIVGPTMFFDNAARQVCTIKQVRTNSPLHALVTLNDTTYIEAARALAQRVMLAQCDDAARLTLAFRLATARPPTDAERAILLARLQTLTSQYTHDQPAAAKLLAVGELKNHPALKPTDLAAWTGLCSLILNLDEVLNK